MRRIPRWLLFTAIVVVLALGTLASVAISAVRQPFPQHTGRVSLAGLSSPVEVLRDSFGVPHIYADDPEDLFEAQGYVHAQDRFYEMDFRRHLASGRLAEWFGPEQVQADAYIRTLGWRRVAEAELALVSPSTRRYLDAYASGVNAYLRDRSPAELSLELRLLGLQGLDYTPEPWSAVDSLAWLKVLAWELGSNAESEAERARVIAAVGADRAADLYPSYPLEGFEPILGRGAVVGQRFDPGVVRASARPLTGGVTSDQLSQAAPALTAADRVSRVIPRVLGAAGMAGEVGSNSWAVRGSRTASGNAMLANDPHLATSMPAAFTQVGLHCRTVTPSCPFDVSGFSMAALPGVVIGKNRTIAWGLTTSYADVQDLYLEQVEGDTVFDGTTFVPLNTVTEQITVRGEEQPRAIRIRSSRHGPLLSDVDEQLRQVGSAQDPSYAVALAWTALTPGRTMDAMLAIDTATTFTEFRAAARLLGAPSQNLVYADTEGNIGYQLPGAIPVRGRGDGRTPAPGWDPAYDWTGTIPFEELPYVYNPPSGLIVAANQPVIGRQYRYPVGSSHSYGWRSQRLLEVLREAPPLTLDNAGELFTDNTVGAAAEVVPALLKLRVSDSWVAEGQQTLVGWDYSAPADSAAAAYFYVVLHDILKGTFRDELPQELWPTGGDRWNAVVATLMDEPRNPWWDDVTTTDQVETRDDILRAAMTLARKEATSLMTRDPAGWQWGKIHTVTLRNQTLGVSGVGAIERLFNRGPYPVGGGPAVVEAMAFDDRVGYTVTTAPTLRMVVDVGEPDGARWVNQSGVSGHPYHRNYMDQIELWRTGRLWPFVSTREAVDARTTDTQVLEPGG